MTPVPSLARLVDRARERPDCVVLPPAGPPALPAAAVPQELDAFYRLCGGMTVRAGHDYGLVINGPDDLPRTNDVVLSEPVAPGDRSLDWVVVAHGEGSRIDLVSLDLHPARSGRCYDSFWDVHAVAGSCAVVAVSVADLLRRALDSTHEAWWWTADDFEGLGDAYG